ncbi:MAG TPA: DNA topoisomerase VI subunit B [Candidatus Aenigmarchaeota archaeon]|nr:DNA topoisomerase VI subunit B [Candidatus Aenigmarchaeota archaeon]
MIQKTAEEMAREHKEISISQFFEKNRHLLGYDNKTKALLTIVKEGVDNALDATEEAGILPDIYVKIEELDREKYKIVIKDNGPGIVRRQIPNIFGKLLYGSKFHRLRQSRGQQGIGISGCVLYSQLTTGEPTRVISSTGDGKTHKYEIKIDVNRNEPVILKEEVVEDDEERRWHGVQITFIAEGIYREHKQSVLEYLKQVAISNPYANIVFDSPNGRIEFVRGVDRLPKEPKEIKPHLYGVEVGIMARMIEETKARSLLTFLITEFSRVGKTSAEEICKKAGLDPKIIPKKLEHKDIVNLVHAIKEVKLSRPPTDCLSPLGKEFIEKGLKKELNPEFIAALSRPPEVYRGWPFQIEVGVAYGGSITEHSLMRFANRVPLLYQQGDCAITKAVSQIDWKRYGLQGDKMPEGPVVLFVHMVSVWVPFNSESKESIASYPIILKEIKLALQECLRKLSVYLSGIRKAAVIKEKKLIFEKYAHDTALAIEELTGEDKEKIKNLLMQIVQKRWSEVEEESEKEGENNGEENPKPTENNGSEGESEESGS